MAKAAPTIASLWQRVHGWLAERMPRAWLKSPGLKETDIRKVETIFGRRLPDDVREAYSIQNGLPDVEIFGDGVWLPLLKPKKPHSLSAYANAIDSWQWWQKQTKKGMFGEFTVKPVARINAVYWDSGWLPIFDNIQGDMMCVDMNPAKYGMRGQIIDWRRLDGPVKVHARSFRHWLQRLASAMVRGEYHLDASNRPALLVKKKRWKQMQEQEAKAAAGPG